MMDRRLSPVRSREQHSQDSFSSAIVRLRKNCDFQKTLEIRFSNLIKPNDTANCQECSSVLVPFTLMFILKTREVPGADIGQVQVHQVQV